MSSNNKEGPYLIFDGTNLLYRVYYANINAADGLGADLAFHSAFMTIQKYFKQFKPEKVFMCFDAPSWRKDYTQSEACVSKKLYKGNRRQDMTPSEQEAYKKFLNYMQDFEELLDKYTTVTVLRKPKLEADDFVGGLCDIFFDKQIVVVSSDKDFMQLLKYKNVTVLDPMTGKNRDLTEWGDDANYFMFMKCIKGDTSDNVQSAFPRVRKTRIAKAYTDEYERVKLMKETWTNQNEVTMSVEALYNENVLLMDLTAQPEDIKVMIMNHIDDKLSNPAKFNYMQVLKFLGRHELRKITDAIDNFIPMMSR